MPTIPASIDLSKIEILDPVTTAKGGKSASIFYQGSGPSQLETGGRQGGL